MRNKKGQLGNLQGIITTLVVIGVVVAAGFLMLDEFKYDLNDESFSVTNETGAYINSTGYTVDEADSPGFNSFKVTEARNASDGTVIGPGNYTTTDQGVIFNATSTTYPNVNLDYTYKAGENSFEAVDETTEAMTTIPELLSLIILVAVIGIVLAVVFNVFPGTRASASA